MGSDWLDGNGGGSQVDVHELLGNGAMKGLLEMVESGALVSMGTTSDGGALAITVTVDGRWRREYVRTADELELYLAAAVPAITEAASASRPSAAQRERPRRRKA